MIVDCNNQSLVIKRHLQASARQTGTPRDDYMVPLVPDLEFIVPTEFHCCCVDACMPLLYTFLYSYHKDSYCSCIDSYCCNVRSYCCYSCYINFCDELHSHKLSQWWKPPTELTSAHDLCCLTLAH